MTEETWLPTSKAVAHLGRSKRQLLAAANSGLLTQGVHYLRGHTPKSPITWNIPAIVRRYAELQPMPSPFQKSDSPTEKQ